MFPQMYHQELMHSYLIYITEQDVKDILQTLKIGKSCGDDSITHQMLEYKQTIRIQHPTTVQTDDQDTNHSNSINRRSGYKTYQLY